MEIFAPWANLFLFISRLKTFAKFCIKYGLGNKILKCSIIMYACSLPLHIKCIIERQHLHKNEVLPVVYNTHKFVMNAIKGCAGEWRESLSQYAYISQVLFAHYDATNIHPSRGDSTGRKKIRKGLKSGNFSISLFLLSTASSAVEWSISNQIDAVQIGSITKYEHEKLI